jgi:DNA-directed RNA polymerase subunit RPC12/RpoP
MSDDDKAYRDNGNRVIHRPMTRCATCRAWWSIAEDDPDPKCPCGGRLVIVDVEKEAAHLDYKPFVPPPPVVKTGQ